MFYFINTDSSRMLSNHTKIVKILPDGHNIPDKNHLPDAIQTVKASRLRVRPRVMKRPQV